MRELSELHLLVHLLCLLHLHRLPSLPVKLQSPLCFHLTIQPLPISGFPCPASAGLKTAGVSSLSSREEML